MVVVQGASVKMGARLVATEVSITRVEVVGVAVRDEGSSLKLTACMCQKHSRRYRSLSVTRGVHVHTHATAELHSTTVRGSSMCCGVDVAAGASAALAACTVRDAGQVCVQFRSGGTGSVEDSVVAGSRTRQGLCVQGALSLSRSLSSCSCMRASMSASLFSWNPVSQCVSQRLGATSLCDVVYFGGFW